MFTNGENGKLHNQRFLILIIGLDLFIIGITGCIFISDFQIVFQSFITLGITFLSVATITFLFESKGWINHLKNILSDLMTDPKFLLESFTTEGIREKCKKILKGGLKIDILGDEFFDTIDSNYINPLLGPIYENYHMIINFKLKKIHGAEVVSASSRRCFQAYNPTDDKLNLFPDSLLVSSKYYIDKKYKNFLNNIKNKKMEQYNLNSLKINDCECLNDYICNFNKLFDDKTNTTYAELECKYQLLPYKICKTSTTIDYEAEHLYPLMTDYAMWTFKTIVKGITIMITYPDKKLKISSYVTRSAPDKSGQFAKKLSGSSGEKVIISDEIFFPGTTLFIYWSPK